MLEVCTQSACIKVFDAVLLSQELLLFIVLMSEQRCSDLGHIMLFVPLNTSSTLGISYLV